MSIRLSHLVGAKWVMRFDGVQVKAIIGLLSESKLQIVVLVVHQVRLRHDSVLNRNV